jgi:multiple sugar transport system ATP-binding protein
MVAGLEEISGGTVEIDGEVVNDLQPKDRNIAMVFQNYALYPHLTVFENMAFSLRLQRPKISQEVIYQKVTEAAEILGITEYLTRKPRALSGGQRQRVAIGRAMVRNSKVFLMDEPLSNLDAKLRNQMRAEIILLRKKIDTTFIYVTHDQDEALTMSDRIVIIDKGIIQQNDTPQNIYMYPNTTFVADFIGESNIMNGDVVSVKNGITSVKIEDDVIFEVNSVDADDVGKKINIMVRPENIKISINPLKNSLHGVVKDIIYDGAVTKLFIDTDGELNLKVNAHGIVNLKEGEGVYLKIEKDSIVAIRG